MEKLASRKLRLSAKETMRIAENLYTKGFISYPRTETNIFPKDLDLSALVQEQSRDPNWGGNQNSLSSDIKKIYECCKHGRKFCKCTINLLEHSWQEPVLYCLYIGSVVKIIGTPICHW